MFHLSQCHRLFLGIGDTAPLGCVVSAPDKGIQPTATLLDRASIQGDQTSGLDWVRPPIDAGRSATVANHAGKDDRANVWWGAGALTSVPIGALPVSDGDAGFSHPPLAAQPDPRPRLP